ncbi:MAG: hypothetical protein AAB617_00765 [Patescibacteria group bacterium]
MMKVEEKIRKLLSFYSVLGRPLTFLEIARLLPELRKTDILEGLNGLVATGYSKEDGGFWGVNTNTNLRKQTDFLLDQKWNKFLKYKKIFGFIPFIDFVFGTGSMALGNVHPDSDFDVLIGARQDRIFTTRIFTILALNIFGIRRKRIDHKKSAKNKICLNHFVTPASYKLKEPYNIYWKELYKNIVPVFGNRDKVQEFLDSNKWAGDLNLINDERLSGTKSIVAKLFEFVLGGFMGGIIESFLGRLQISKINKHLEGSLGYKPRVIFDENELEFHLDTKRIETMLSKSGE